MKKWKLMPGNPGKAKHIEEELGLPALVTEVLVARGLDTPAKVKEFITEEIPFTDPMAYKDMDKAADRIGGALEDGERVCIYGDYDCDGMTATVLLYDYLQSIGCDVWYYIPDRENEGYGLNKDAIDFIAARETDLIITVDNGISAIEEIDYAASLGLDVVVTDHHKPRDVLPSAVAVVDPHRRDEDDNDKIYRDLAGVGVAFKLVCALENDDGWGIAEQYADLVSIGTVADIVPLTGENRILVRQGLSLIPETTNPGLRALVEETGLAGKKLTAEMLAFGIAPKLNSAARLGSAYQVTELLTTEDEERAAELARDLCEQNHRRQELEQRTSSEREAQKGIVQRRQEASNELEKARGRLSGMQKEYDDIISQLWDDYDITFSTAESLAIEITEPQKAQRRLNELRGKIKSLGSVNLSAIEEYKEVSERYEFYKVQITDAEKSRDELRALIKSLMNQMRSIFLDRFTQIAGNFAVVFRELFGGGEGKLTLTDPNNVLESGIEITVQPPGKIINNLASLSGGEQTFVAIAIYFAILKVRPAPFCILDEIEAALDEANVDRYADYLLRLTENTQFIAITHRRGTMEHADRLYGVTMQEDGVSKLLELALSDVDKIEK